MTEGEGGRPASAQVSSNLRQRFLSALVLGPLTLILTWLGGAAFSVLAAAAGIILLWEWTVIIGAERRAPPIITAFIALVLAGAAASVGAISWALAIVATGAIGVGVLGGGRRLARWTAEGLVYAGLAVITLVALRNGSEGLVAVVFLLLVVWATDIAAYFVGRALGGPKLWPRVSPGKTWSGACGGVVAALLIGAVAAIVLGRLPVWFWLAAAFALSVASQAGDLLESALKRRFGVKDSGRLIPGHGGLLDRVDGLVGAAVVGYAVAVVAAGSISDPVGGVLAGLGR